MVTKRANFLSSIIGADESFVCGKPRESNKHNVAKISHPRGRDTKKKTVIGAVEGGGNAAARVLDKLSGKAVLDFFKDSVDFDNAPLITDKFKSHGVFRGLVCHSVINHCVQYVDGVFYTNAIQGVWNLLKVAWFRSHRHYQKWYMPLYLAETCWKYNRNNVNLFDRFMHGCFK